MDARAQMHGSDGEASGDDRVSKDNGRSSWIGKIKKLFLSKNSEKSKEVLEEFIGGTTDLCESFLMQFEEEHVKLIAEKMAKMELWNMKAFANKSDLFQETGPTWVGGSESCDSQEVARAALHLQKFLLEARERVAKAEVEIKAREEKKRRGRDSLSRGRSRGRKKFKPRRKAGDESDACSTTSSVKRQEAAEDLSKIIEKSQFKDVPMDYFPHAKLAVKTVKRCKVGAVLSSEAIERWIPQYVGSELPSAGQKKMVSEREKSVAMPLAHLLEQSAAFWMSHGIAGRVSPMAVMRHNMLLVRIASQGSTAVAVQYERTLIQHIRNLKGEPDMNMLLGDKVDAVETAVHIHFSRVAKQKEPPPLSRNMHYGNTGGLMKVKHEEEGQASSAGRGQEQRFTQTNAGREPPSGRFEKKLCFYHDPAAKKTCMHGHKCRNEHIDTNKPENKKRLEKARQAAGRK